MYLFVICVIILTPVYNVMSPLLLCSQHCCITTHRIFSMNQHLKETFLYLPVILDVVCAATLWLNYDSYLLELETHSIYFFLKVLFDSHLADTTLDCHFQVLLFFFILI